MLFENILGYHDVFIEHRSSKGFYYVNDHIGLRL